MTITKIKNGSIWRAPTFIGLTLHQKLFYMFMFDAGSNVTKEYLVEMAELLSMDLESLVTEMLSWCRTNPDLLMYQATGKLWVLGDIHDLLWTTNQQLSKKNKADKTFIFK